ncbi:hypothetical protein [Devosia sp. 2618]|uniref:hypothetical protein n=1 Tax=Devosia sp. 2618 TaxID=3156454 RepID=UPI0033952FF1
MTLPVPFRLHVLKPNLVSNAHEFPERSNVDGGLAQKHLQLASGHFGRLVSSLKQSVHNVCHRFLHGNDSLAQEPVARTFREQFHEAALLWGVIALSLPASITLAYFARFESWPDLSFLIGGL